MMFDNNGDNGDPCGVPSATDCRTPSAMIPASK